VCGGLIFGNSNGQIIFSNLKIDYVKAPSFIDIVQPTSSMMALFLLIFYNYKSSEERNNAIFLFEVIDIFRLYRFIFKMIFFAFNLFLRLTAIITMKDVWESFLLQ
jgi:hypothetical protein